MVHLALSNPGYSQKELGEMLGIKQNTVSNRLKRAYYDEILELLTRYQTKTIEIIK
jgi:DNA-directed RNA polymerase specialized sigma24 family protein